jgi:hypothetical protein
LEAARLLLRLNSQVCGQKQGERIIIAQPTIDLTKQSVGQFRERWPNVQVREIHGGTCGNVSRAITEHTKQSSYGTEMMASETHHRCVPDFDHQVAQAIRRWRGHSNGTCSAAIGCPRASAFLIMLGAAS